MYKKGGLIRNMGTKIVVVHLKQLIKTALVAIVGIIVIVFLIFLFIPKEDKSQAIYEPGTYSSQIILHNNPVSIEVTVSKDEIMDIQMLNMGETQEVFYPLFEPALEDLASAIIENQSTDVSVENDASVTNEILINAVDAALEQAKVDNN